MPILDVVLYPDDPLTLKAEPFETIGLDVAELAANMLETMEAYEGVGLAGPQVGIAKQILVLREPGGEPMCLVNPELSGFQGSQEGEEGCLSLPRLYASVSRASQIHVTANDENGKPIEFDAEGFLARIIQHECDHLEGIVFPERLDILSRESVLREWEEVRQELLQATERA